MDAQEHERLGTCYWAILKFAYQHANHPVRPEELIDGVEHVMSDRDVLAWERFCNKPKAKPWQERVLMNARILTRRGGQHPFGRRLEERGHRFDLEQNEACRPYFILRTSTDEPSRPRPRGRPRRIN